MVKNKKSVLILFLLTLVLFVIFLFIESSMAGRYERKPAVVAVMEVPENLHLTKGNLSRYFEVKNVDASLFTEDTVTSLEEVKDLYTGEIIHTKEVLSKKSLMDNKTLTADLVNPVKVSFSVSAIQNAAAGRIRTGEKINIYTYDNAMKTTEKVMEGLYVQEAYDSEGKAIDSSDNKSIAVTFAVLINSAEEAYFYDSIAGKELYVSAVEVEKDGEKKLPEEKR